MATPSFTLTYEEKVQLAALAESLVKTAVDEYIDHLTVHNGVVDESRWKKVKQRHDMRAYRERSPKDVSKRMSRGNPQISNNGSSYSYSYSTSSYSQRSSTFSQHSSNNSSNYSSSYSYNSSDFESENKDGSKTIAPMIAFGSIEGTFNDAMYAAISISTEDMQLMTAYLDDGFVDWLLVAPIIKPSEEEPFHYLCLKYAVKGNPPLLSAVIRRRSTLYIEANGIAITPDGERIGYHVRHSVDIPRFQEPTEVSSVRAKLSFSTILRQRKENCVEVFMKGVINPMGGAPAGLIAITTAEVCLSISANAHCTDMKKLTRILSSQPAAVRALLATANAASGRSHLSGSSDAITTTKSANEPVSCGQCSKSISSTFARFNPSSKEKHCAMCGSRLCSSCRVYKTLFARSPTKEKELTQTVRAFCTSCLACVVSASSVTCAALDVRALRGEQVDYALALNTNQVEVNRLRKIWEV